MLFVAVFGVMNTDETFRLVEPASMVIHVQKRRKLSSLDRGVRSSAQNRSSNVSRSIVHDGPKKEFDEGNGHRPSSIVMTALVEIVGCREGSLHITSSLGEAS